jgi:hypothetical protein
MKKHQLTMFLIIMLLIGATAFLVIFDQIVTKGSVALYIIERFFEFLS